MENVSNKKYFTTLVSCAFCMLLVFVATTLCSVFNQSFDFNALAETNIVLRLDDKGNKSFNALTGATYSIISNDKTTDILIAFDDDADNWIICSKNNQGEIPYISIKDLEENNPEIYQSPTLNNQGLFESKITLYSNGFLYIKCLYVEDGETKYIEKSERISVIDWVAPNIVKDSVLVYADACSVSFYVKVTDYFPWLRYETAKSGINKAEFFFIDRELTEYMQQKESPSGEFDVSFDDLEQEIGYTSIKVQTAVVDDDVLDVQFTETGYYYLALEDKVGNMAIYLLGHYKKPKGADFKVKYSFGELVISEYLLQAENYIAYYEGREDFAQVRVEELKEALSNVYYVFSMEEDETIKRTAYENFNKVKYEFEKATEGVILVLDSVGSENNLGTIIKCVNFNEKIVETVLGDEITLIIKASSLNAENILVDISSLKDKDYNYVIKIEYELLKNDEHIVPNAPLVFNIDYNLTIKDLLVISTIDGLNAKLYEVERGLQYFKLESNTDKREFYVFYNVDTKVDNLNPIKPIWIVVIGIYVGLSAVVTLLSVAFSLRKQKKSTNV